jgi:hypothetical protein
MQFALAFTFLSALAAAIPAPSPSDDDHLPLTNGEVVQSFMKRNKGITSLAAATLITGAGGNSSIHLTI